MVTTDLYDRMIVANDPDDGDIDETRMYLNTKTQYYNNHLHVGSIIPLKSIII